MEMFYSQCSAPHFYSDATRPEVSCQSSVQGKKWFKEEQVGGSFFSVALRSASLMH